MENKKKRHYFKPLEVLLEFPLENQSIKVTSDTSVYLIVKRLQQEYRKLTKLTYIISLTI